MNGILWEQRLKLGFTIKDVGEAIGINPYRYLRYENGVDDFMKASFDVACGILLFLQLDIEAFFRGDYRATPGLRLYLRNYDAEATGMLINNNHLIVLKGSRISPDSTLGEKGYERVEELRQRLIAEGVIKDRLFTQDYDFRNPTEACAVVCGRYFSGPSMWRTEDGVTLERVKKGNGTKPERLAIGDAATGEILREQRFKLGLTVKDVCEAVGITPRRYRCYEEGRLDIMKASFDVACRILLFFSLDIEAFYRGECNSGDEELGVALYLRNRRYGAEAKGLLTKGNRLIVLKGSRISPDSKLGKSEADLRQRLIAEGVIKDRLFTQDYEFHSPSLASHVICGRSVPGLRMWSTEDGGTLWALRRRQ